MKTLCDVCDIYFSIRSEESRVFAESVIYVLLSRGFFTSVIERVFFVSLLWRYIYKIYSASSFTRKKIPYI